MDVKMEIDKAISIADAFLSKRLIGHCEPVKVQKTAQGDMEVIFTVPEALQPDVVVDPPEVRVMVYAGTQEAELLPDM
jgi:hypothetical protein